jgi:hypothetical protein
MYNSYPVYLNSKIAIPSLPFRFEMPLLPISEDLHLSLKGNRIRGNFQSTCQKGVRKQDKE